MTYPGNKFVENYLKKKYTTQFNFRDFDKESVVKIINQFKIYAVVVMVFL